MVCKSPGPTPWLESAAQLAEDGGKLRAGSGRNLTYPDGQVKENPRAARISDDWPQLCAHSTQQFSPSSESVISRVTEVKKRRRSGTVRTPAD